MHMPLLAILTALSCFMTTVYAVSYFSGGHINPAVTLAAGLSGHMGWARAALYILAQVGGY